MEIGTMADATGTTGSTPADLKRVKVDATVDGKGKSKGGFVATFAADVTDAVIDQFHAAFGKVKELGLAYKTSTEAFADALDKLALVVARKGRSTADLIKDGQQQTAYKEASKYAKEVLGLAVDSGAITQARYRAKKARKEAAAKAARIAAGKEAAPVETPAAKAARVTRENITSAAKKDATFEQVMGGANSIIEKLRTVMPDACIAQRKDGSLLKDEYVSDIRNLSALFAVVADEYEEYVPSVEDEDEEQVA